MSFSDYIQISGGRPGVFVQLTSNTTLTAYVSDAATDANGMFTFTTTPPSDPLGYIVKIGPAAIGPWTATGDNAYFPPGLINNISVIPFSELSTDMGIGAVRNGITRDTGASLGLYTRFRAFASSMVASAALGLQIQQSDDSTTWFTTNQVTVGAGTLTGSVWSGGTIVEGLIVKRYVRVSYTNGGTAMTTSVFNLSCALVA